MGEGGDVGGGGQGAAMNGLCFLSCADEDRQTDNFCHVSLDLDLDFN